MFVLMCLLILCVLNVRALSPAFIEQLIIHQLKIKSCSQCNRLREDCAHWNLHKKRRFHEEMGHRHNTIASPHLTPPSSLETASHCFLPTASLSFYKTMKKICSECLGLYHILSFLHCFSKAGLLMSTSLLPHHPHFCLLSTSANSFYRFIKNNQASPTTSIYSILPPPSASSSTVSSTTYNHNQCLLYFNIYFASK